MNATRCRSTLALLSLATALLGAARSDAQPSPGAPPHPTLHGRSAPARAPRVHRRSLPPGAPHEAALPFGSVRRLARELETIHARQRTAAVLKTLGLLGAGSDSEPGEEASGADALAARLYYLHQRAFPQDTVDWSAYARAADHRDKMPSAANPGNPTGAMSGAITGNWNFVGPNNLRVPYQQYYGTGPLSGRVNAVAYDPKVPGTCYVSSAGGGFWQSIDNGMDWVCLSNGLNTKGAPYWKYQQAGSIAIDPTHTGTIYVVGADTYYFGAFQDRFLGNAIMKTTDAGATWTPVGSASFGNNGVSKVIVDPENPKILTATTGNLDSSAPKQGKIWRSVDGGATWKAAVNTAGKAVPTGVWTDVVYGALTAGGVRYYYATAFNPVTTGANPWLLYRSSNRGVSWQALSAPSDWGTQKMQVGIDIAASAVFPSIVYLLSGTNRHIYQSVNAGQSWTNTTNNFPNGPYNTTTMQYEDWSQIDYDYDIVCSSRTDSAGHLHDVIYVGAIDIAQSVDDGATWQSVGGPTYAQNNGALTHNDQHALAVNPANPNELLVGNDGGVYRFSYAPTANTWIYTPLNTTLGITQFYKLAVSSLQADTIIGGAQDNAGPATEGDLTGWINVGGGDSGWCAIDPTDAGIQFMTQTTGTPTMPLHYTTDSWVTTNNTIDLTDTLSANIPFLCPIVLDPSDPTHLYAATQYLYRWDSTQSAGHQWSGALSGALCGASVVNAVLSLAVSEDGTCVYTGSDTGTLSMSLNSGNAPWQVVNTSHLPRAAITAIKVMTPNPQAILVGLGGTGHGHLYYCADVTHPTWQALSGSGSTGLPDINLNAIEVDPHDPLNTLYVGTDAGVFRSTNFGGTWSNASNALGLPTVQVNDLKADAGNEYLYAATFGAGIWRIQIAPPATYTVLALPVPTGTSPSYYGYTALNASGEAVGTDYRASNGDWFALLWTDAVAGPRKIGPLFTTATALNNLQQITGGSEDNAGNEVPFLYDDGVLTLLPLPANAPSTQAHATTINNYGQVAGNFDLDGGGTHAMLWTPTTPNGVKGAMTDLGNAAVTGINDIGQLTGTSYTTGAMNTALLWTPTTHNTAVGSAAKLGVPAGMSHSFGYAINAGGTIVGTAEDANLNYFPAVWTPTQANATTGSWLLLPLLPSFSASGTAVSINSAGDIVGYLETATPTETAALWKRQPNGSYKAMDLNTAIPKNSGWQLIIAHAINDNGQILCSGTGPNGIGTVLLTPH